MTTKIKAQLLANDENAFDHSLRIQYVALCATVKCLPSCKPLYRGVKLINSDVLKMSSITPIGLVSFMQSKDQSKYTTAGVQFELTTTKKWYRSTNFCTLACWLKRLTWWVGWRYVPHVLTWTNNRQAISQSTAPEKKKMQLLSNDCLLEEYSTHTSCNKRQLQNMQVYLRDGENTTERL